MGVVTPTSDRDIGRLLSKAYEFKDKLDGLRATLPTPDFEWYPHDSLSNLEHLDALLTGPNRPVLDIPDGMVADIGCQDGDVAFFLESAGFRVQAIDCPLTNHNHMRAIRALHRALESSVEIYEVDLDSQFFLPESSYEIVFLLGVLYHLKNPFYVLDSLSRRARYCLLSTRIAAVTPDRKVTMAGQPLAYLATDTELNSDDSAYWIFSETALRRMLDRTNWDILDYLSIGATGASDPLDRDERCFCLLRSRHGQLRGGTGSPEIQMGSGWHPPEDRGWRWTKRLFNVTAHSGEGTISRLRIKLHFPHAVIEQWGSVTLTARINGADLRPETYSKPGDAEFVRGFPAAHDIVAEFELDHAIAPDRSDPRERGIIVASIEFQ